MSKKKDRMQKHPVFLNQLVIRGRYYGNRERKYCCEAVGVNVYGDEGEPGTSVYGPVTAGADCKMPSKVMVN